MPPRLFTHPAFTGGVLLALVDFAAFTSIFFNIRAVVAGRPWAFRAAVGAGGHAVRRWQHHRRLRE